MKRLLVASALAGAMCANVAVAADMLPQANDPYFVAAQQTLQQKLHEQVNTNRAKNVILFVGDGMSIPTVTAARIYEGQKRGVDGESNSLVFGTFPNVALSKTYTHDAQIADSAPTASAMMAGVKMNNGTIGVSSEVARGDCKAQLAHPVKSLAAQAEEQGMSTGVISTARLTHATPAATYVHTADRNWENDADLSDAAKADGCPDIASQMIAWPAGDGFEVAFGGGRRNFIDKSMNDPEDKGKTGSRTDGRDLTKEWVDAKGKGASYIWNKEQFDAIDVASAKHVLGLFDRSHMEYEADRAKDAGGEPSLAEMTGKAIDILSKNDKGYFLMVEAGRIDHAHHEGNAARALEDTVALNDAVKEAMSKVDMKNTLIIVTADHSHTMTISGYAERGNPILGLSQGKADDGKAYTTLGYMNGPGALKDELRPDLANVDTTDVDFLQPALIPMSSETHAGDDVAIFAAGPWSHLFHGVVEQNFIYHVMSYASKIEDRMASK
ncbi:alkaline phosphatase [Thalassospira alkalitolerans]|uniref:alkaline phosphatase n=1 Tax=Thalassospira alkalitolerans TaxID=1293890 RepID=UPI003AA98087